MTFRSLAPTLCATIILASVANMGAVSQVHPIFPQASVFVFPRSVVGGVTKIDKLSPQGFKGPVVPLMRTVYSISPSRFIIDYRVAVFRSSSEATLSTAWQAAHASTYKYPVKCEFAAISGEKLYTNGQGGLVAILVYRNLELVVFGYTGPVLNTPSGPIGSSHPVDAMRAIVALEAKLFARAQTYANSVGA